MTLFRRKRSDEDDVRWLAPTELRTRKPRGRGLLFTLILLIGAAAVFGAVVLFLPKPAPRQSAQDNAPASAPAPTPPILETPAPASPAPLPQQTTPLDPTPSAPAPAPLQPWEQPSATTPSELSPAPETAPETPAEENAPAPTTAPEAAPEQPAESPLTGAFPTTSAESDDPEGANFAVYLNEAAPDEANARNLVIEAQKRFASVLGGGRLSYRRVRVGEENMFRVRLAGVTRARAAEICEALQGAGAACEVGPR